MAEEIQKVKIAVLPGNVALISPPLEQFPPLERYRPFLYKDGYPSGALQGEEVAAAQAFSPCSAFPAGLVRRFEEELAATGHDIEVDDRRRHFEKEFGLNKKLCGRSWGEEGPFLRAVRIHPQGQLGYQRRHDMLWRVVHLCHLWPRARCLIICSTTYSADMLYQDLASYFHELLGVLTRREAFDQEARCILSTQAMLPRLRLAAWQVVILLIHSSQEVSRTTYRAVVRGRAPRVYALVMSGARLGPRTRLRLEALAGPVID